MLASWLDWNRRTLELEPGIAMKLSYFAPTTAFIVLAPWRWAEADCDPPTAPECCPGPECPPILDGFWQNAPDLGGEVDVDQVATQVTDHPPTGPTGVFYFNMLDGSAITGGEDFNPIYPGILYDAPPGWSYVLHDCKGAPWEETLCGYKWWHIDWALDACGNWVPSLLTYRDPRVHILPEPKYRYWYFTYIGGFEFNAIRPVRYEPAKRSVTSEACPTPLGARRSLRAL